MSQNAPDNETAAAEDDVVDTPSEVIDHDPLVQLFGSHAKTKILVVLTTAERPLGISTICERAGFGDRHSWYDYEDELLATGLVEEAGREGNSRLFALVDADEDERTEWLEKLRDWTGAYCRASRRPGESPDATDE